MLTRCDKDGVPSLVQYWQWDSAGSWYEVRLFDGRTLYVEPENIDGILPGFKRWTTESRYLAITAYVEKYYHYFKVMAASAQLNSERLFRSLR